MVKKTHNDPQNTTQKTTNCATLILLTTGGERKCAGRVSSSCVISGTRRVTQVKNPVISYERRRAALN